MVVIPNSDRDDMVRYIDLLCEAYKEKAADSTVAYNLVRRAGFLRKSLVGRQPFSLSDIPEDVRTDITKRI